LKDNLSAQLPMVLGDASALRQVFLNLLLNALQSIETAGNVTIATEINEDQIVTRVIDTGSGIATEMLDQIWTPFFTTKVVGQGQGLGLAVTYDIVEKHQGAISVRSKVGEGTEFIVRLPGCQDN